MQKNWGALHLNELRGYGPGWAKKVGKHWFRLISKVPALSALRSDRKQGPFADVSYQVQLLGCSRTKYGAPNHG